VRRRIGWLDSAEQVEVDLNRSALSLDRAFADVDAIVHLAAPNEAIAVSNPEQALAETVTATQRLAAAAVAARVRRFVYVSTVHVYGETMAHRREISEDAVPEPRGAYAIARLASEHVLSTAARDGIEVVILRLTNSVGAPAHPSVQRWTLVANDLCRQAVVDESLKLRSDGTQWRDFVPLVDVCRALTTAACTARPGPGTYNLGSGTPMTVRDLARMVQDSVERHTGKRPRLHAPDPAAAPAPPCVVRTERLARAGLTLTGSVAEAVDETVEFCLANKGAITAMSEIG